MKPISIEEFEMLETSTTKRPSKYFVELTAFLNSHAPAAELETFGAAQASSTYAIMAKRYELPIRIISRSGKVYAFYDENGATRKKEITPWQKRLSFTVIGSEYATPCDINETVDEILKELSDTYRDVVLMRFRDEMTLEEAGQTIGVTRERARQIQKAAIRKLQAPRLRPKWIFGATLANQLKEERENEIRKQRAEKQAEKEAETTRLKAELDEKIRNFSSTPIEDLDLSVRSYNCLRRDGGIETIGDLVNKSISLGEYGFVDWLLSLYHLGRKSAEEIITKLNAFMEQEGVA